MPPLPSEYPVTLTTLHKRNSSTALLELKSSEKDEESRAKTKLSLLTANEFTHRESALPTPDGDPGPVLGSMQLTPGTMLYYSNTIVYYSIASLVRGWLGSWPSTRDLPNYLGSTYHS